MSKKNAVVTTSDIFTVKKVGDEQKFSLSPTFRTELLNLSQAVGAVIQTAGDKVRIAMNLVRAFDEYKRITKGALPAFVADCLDATCPRASGAAGTKERKAINQNKTFCGVEYLMKKGKAGIALLASQKAMSDEGVDLNDATKVGAYNKEKRDAKAEAFEKAFCKCIVDFARHGVTETTIENLLVSVLRKKEKDSDDLNKTGIALRDAAVKAVFKSMGGKLDASGQPDVEAAVKSAKAKK